jgi:hypothetical protein
MELCDKIGDKLNCVIKLIINTVVYDDEWEFGHCGMMGTLGMRRMLGQWEHWNEGNIGTRNI